jgi:hypothetical protein
MGRFLKHGRNFGRNFGRKFGRNFGRNFGQFSWQLGNIITNHLDILVTIHSAAVFVGRNAARPSKWSGTRAYFIIRSLGKDFPLFDKKENMISELT